MGNMTQDLEERPSSDRRWMFVTQDGSARLLEFDSLISPRAHALATGPIEAPAPPAVSAVFSPDGTRLAYVVDSVEGGWMAVTEAPDWEQPIAAWSLPSEARGQGFDWLGNDELVVGDSWHRRYSLSRSEPDELGWIDDVVATESTRLSRLQDTTNYQLLQPATEPALIEVDIGTQAYLASDGDHAAFVAQGAPPGVRTDLLRVNAIGWIAPPAPMEELCIRESPSCPIITEQPRSRVTRVRWLPDGSRAVVEVEARAGTLDVNRETRPVPHASGYSLSVVEAGRPLLLGAAQASPERLLGMPSPTLDSAMPPERTIWAWGTPTGADAWGLLGDGRLYYLDWGDPHLGTEPASVNVLPSVSAPLEAGATWRSGRSSVVQLALPTSDERHLLLVGWDFTSQQSSLSSLRLDAGDIADEAERVIFESDESIVRPWLSHTGSAFLFGVTTDGVVGSDCSFGCDDLRYHLVTDPEAPLVALPAGLARAGFTPDDAGIVGILDGFVVYLPLDAPDQIYRLLEAEWLHLPSVWPRADGN